MERRALEILSGVSQQTSENTRDYARLHLFRCGNSCYNLQDACKCKGSSDVLNFFFCIVVKCRV